MVDQAEEDNWYGKSKSSCRKEEAGAGARSAVGDAGKSVPVGDGPPPAGNVVAGAGRGEEGNAAGLLTAGEDGETVGGEDDAEDVGDEEDFAPAGNEGDGGEAGEQIEEGPMKVLMLRELRTRYGVSPRNV